MYHAVLCEDISLLPDQVLRNFKWFGINDVLIDDDPMDLCFNAHSGDVAALVIDTLHPGGRRSTAKELKPGDVIYLDERTLTL